MSKWRFVEPFVKREVARLKENQLSVNKQEIANAMVKHFDLTIDKDYARKVVSNILNQSKKMPLPLKDQKKVLAGNKSADTLSIKELERLLEHKKQAQTNKKQFTTPGIHIVSGCWHVPFHNKEVVSGLLNLIRDLGDKVKGFHLIGDFLDLHSLSSYDRRNVALVPGLTLKTEYSQGNKVLDLIESILPSDCEKSYIYGNHEDRYNRYIREHENSKIPPDSPTEALRLKERGFSSIMENWSDDFITLGAHLDLMHGTYYNVHCAKKHMDVFRGSVMFVHTHRVQTYIEGDNGSFNIGCMGDIESPVFGYAARATKASWKNGFAIVTIDKNGDYYVQQILCNNNKFYYNGKAY